MAPQSDERPLERRLWAALLVPFALLLAAGTVLALQIAQMSADANLVEHTNEVVAKANDALKRVVDQETGLRGYLLSQDPRFLQPYEAARPLDALRELRQLVADNPGQVARVDAARERYEEWLDQSAKVGRGGDAGAMRHPDALLKRKDLMDVFRASMAEVLDAEDVLRHIRADKAAASTARARVVFIGLLGSVALALALFSRQQLVAISKIYRSALERERGARDALEREEWIRIGHMKVAEAVQGELSLDRVSKQALEAVASYVGAEVGALFAAEPAGLRLRAGFGRDSRAGEVFFVEGEGLVGRAATARAPLVVREVPSGYLQVRSGTGEHDPIELAFVPARSDAIVDAVVELAFLRPVDERSLELLRRVGEPIAIGVRSANYRARLEELLEESQRQGEELQSQQEELRITNEDLSERTKLLTLAQAELEERQSALEANNASLESQREELQGAQRALTDKAAELERANSYKSQFLANMSHELRTPLNSALILAKLLVDNKEGNLTAEQLRFAETIHAAGTDLLVLIDDVLDLSRIEAGKMEVRNATIDVRRIVEGMVRMFEPIARQRAVGLSLKMSGGAPQALATDPKRLQQILKNLLSNAVKFTERGEVALEVAKKGGRIEFSVRDTGIGIAPDQMSRIFEAFHQADGTSARRYGGTGLGLSIARDLARLLGGDLQVESEVGRGSTFTLSLPSDGVPTAAVVEAAAAVVDGGPVRGATQAMGTPSNGTGNLRPAPAVPDDRDRIDRRKRLLLVVEDDPAFAQILVDLSHELAFQCVVAHSADSAVALANELVPSAIILDLRLPDHSGLSVLDRVKQNPATRHVPVHVVSGEDRSSQARSMGAAGYLVKPVSRDQLVGALRDLERRLKSNVRRLLVVDGDANERDSLSALLGPRGVDAVGVGTVAEALEQLKAASFDCVVLDLDLPDRSGSDVLRSITKDDAYSCPPVIVHTKRTLTASEEQELREQASSIIVKGARSQERLIDEVALFLHRVDSDLPPARKSNGHGAHNREAAFEGRRILVVEDDVRTVFALLNVLEPRGVSVVVARNGREALSALEARPDVDLALMDIMMPEMDGLEATRAIRKSDRWAKLPIIALTAKTRREDQERCLAAGANDYIAKPLDVDVLLSLLRVWMPR